MDSCGTIATHLSDEEACVDFSFTPDMVQGRSKQQSLRSCGYINRFELQLDQDQHRDLEALHPAWSVVLEHTALDCELACTLLCVSRGMRSTVKLLCPHTQAVELPNSLHVHVKQKILRSFARWLPRHASLLHKLDVLDIAELSQDASGAEALLARAMWEAGSKLQLDSCLVYSGLLVQQAAAMDSLRRGLTALTFFPAGGIPHCQAQPVVNALRQLKALRSLRFDANGCRSINNLAPGVSGLTNLTYLLGGFNRRGDVGKYLPTSLAHLEIGSVPAPIDQRHDDVPDDDEEARRYLPPKARGTGKPYTWALGHLTRITTLDFLWEAESNEWSCLYLGDELPPNLLRLYAVVGHGAAVPVLHPLQALTYLNLQHYNTQASHLQSLTNLCKLKDVDLAEFDPEQPDDVLVDAPATYCEAWQHLPLHDLELNGQLPPFVMHHIGKVTRLTQLTLKRHKDSLDDLGSVAAPLQQLKLLQKLRIDWCRPGLPNSNTGFGSDEALSCVKALLQMRRLSDLCLQGFVLPWAAAQSFAELQHLTYLQLERCCLDDFHVNVIALHLTGLQELHVEGNHGVTDVSLPTVGRMMQALCHLDVRHTGISGGGVAWLQPLTSLTRLQVCGAAAQHTSVVALNCVSSWCYESDCPSKAHRRC